MSSANLAPTIPTSKVSTSPSNLSSTHSHHHHHHNHHNHHHSSSSSSSHSQSISHNHNHHQSTNPITIPLAPLVEPPSLFASVAPQIYRSATPTPANHPFLRTLHLKTILSLTPELPSPSLTAFCNKHSINFLHFGLKRWGNQQHDLSSLIHHPSSHPSTNSATSSFTNPSSSGDTSAHLDLSFLHSIPPTSHSLHTPFFSSHTLSFASSHSTPTLTEELVKDSLNILLDTTYHPILVTDTSGIHEIGVLLACFRKLQRWNFATILLEYRHFAGNRARATNERFVEMFDTDLITFPHQLNLPFWFKQQLKYDDAELDTIESFS